MLTKQTQRPMKHILLRMHSLYNYKILNIKKVQPLIYITTTFKWLMYDYDEGRWEHKWTFENQVNLFRSSRCKNPEQLGDDQTEAGKIWDILGPYVSLQTTSITVWVTVTMLDCILLKTWFFCNISNMCRGSCLHSLTAGYCELPLGVGFQYDHHLQF